MIIRELLEAKEQSLTLEKLPYSIGDLAPILSKENVDYHYNVLSKGYVDDLDKIISIDRDYRHGLHRSNELRAERNKVSDEIAELKKTEQDANEKIISMRTVSQKIKNLENSL